ncbi:transposase [Anabaena sp. FACHB-1237]|uniref:transposase n=1 Tax=Anabaena sp. FACHB-1237 TaxID=2692769 RepID=UPI0016806C91|nr:transposase [Anabaena sp. FACHB-1237]MBD2137108.1 transposase [Anabaena sp. FACHB-1237]
MSFSYEQECQPTVKKHDPVGVDLGVKNLTTLSTGEVFENPKNCGENLEKLKKLSRIYARKNQGSNKIISDNI